MFDDECVTSTKRKVKIKSDGKFIACRFLHGIFFVKDNLKKAKKDEIKFPYHTMMCMNT